MIKRCRTGLRVALSMIFMALVSCADLNVDNLNDPDTVDVLATSEDIIHYGGDAFRIWNNAVQGYASPSLSMAAMADEITMPWGLVATFDLSSEPRRGFHNSTTYSYSITTYGIWEQMYISLNQVNDVLKRIEGDGMAVVHNGQDVTGMMKAWCYFIQGIVHGTLGLVFDKAYMIDWNTDYKDVSLSLYKDVEAGSLAFLEKAITTLDETPDFVLPDGYISGYNLTKVEFRELVNSFAARILVYTSRNATQNAAVDWNKVLSYAQQGIDWDYEPYMDDVSWYDQFKTYAVYPGWARIDHRIINLMDHSYPSRWPDDNVSWNTPDGMDPGPASSADLRLTSDFEYLTDQNFVPYRGFYFFSHYRYKRYDNYISQWTVRVPCFLAWENDMMIAEALVRAHNDVAGAAAILNDPGGARKIRGGLPDVSPSTADDALALIFYERQIELILTQGGISFYDMRRRDMLQRRTILHFPVPAAELEIAGLENYTIAGDPDGENISDGSWTGYDGLTSPPAL